MQRLSSSRISDIEFIINRPGPALAQRKWVAKGAECSIDRHSFAGEVYSFHVDILQIQQPATESTRWKPENVDETALGLRCLAVPVTGRCGETVAAMTLCVPAGRIDGRRRRSMLADLRAAGLRASASLRALNQPPGSA